MLYRLGLPLMPYADLATLKEIMRYSLGNYTSNVLSVLPATVIPIMVVNVLGAKDGAYFFVAYSIANVLGLIPYAVSTSLFVEGSHDEPLRRSVVRSAVLILLLLLPLLVLVLAFGDKLLLAFSGEYSAGSTALLRLLALSSLFLVMPCIYMSIKKIQRDLKMMNYLSLANVLLLIPAGYLLMPKFGLIGIGYAWLASNIAVCVVIGWLIIRVEKWR
jgi:O-antigen/teichoic acid export membrane protein